MVFILETPTGQLRKLLRRSKFRSAAFSLFVTVPFFMWATEPTSNTPLNGTFSLDGGGSFIDATMLPSFTGYFMQSGTLSMSNVTFQNFATRGGAGSGGGAGLGGVIFINDGVTTTLNNVNFIGNTAIGGLGGSGLTGGTLNNVLTVTSPGAAGASGSNAYSASAQFDPAGNGANGSNGFPGQMSIGSGPGGAGGNGGQGANGSVNTIYLDYTAAEAAAFAATIAASSTFAAAYAAAITALGFSTSVVATNAASITGEVTALGAEAVAFGATGADIGTGESVLGGGIVDLTAGTAAQEGFNSDPFLAGYPAAMTAPLTGAIVGLNGTETALFGVSAALEIMVEAFATLGTALTQTSAGLSATALALGQINGGMVALQAYTDATGTIDAALLAANATFLTAAEATAYQLAGVSGLGGIGGDGDLGGDGTFGFGGGPGGSGGTGGGAVGTSIGNGGNGGSGADGGNGGFGGGGGSGGTGGPGGSSGSLVTNGPSDGSHGTGGSGGFGGGIGSTPLGGGQGGSGFGGAIFVANGGILNITGPASFCGNDALEGGSNNGGSVGSSAGTDLFMMTGSSVTLDPGVGNTISFGGSIADDSAATLPIFSNARGSGAGITINSGLVIYNDANTYSGETLVAGGVLQAEDGVGVSLSSNINLAGGIFQGRGTLTRFLGTLPSRLQLSSGGFSSAEGNLCVSLGAQSPIVWGTTSYFLGSGTPFHFGSASATDDVTFSNDLDLNGTTQTILTTANMDNSNRAILSGVLSHGSLTVGDGFHNGITVLSGANTYTGATLVSGGTLNLMGSLQSTDVTVSVGTTLEDSGGGFAVGTALTVDGTFTLDVDDTVDTLSGSGAINLNGGTLSINSGTFSGDITGMSISSGITKLSSGTLTLSGVNTYLGPTQLEDGTITLTGSLASQTVTTAVGTTFNDTNGGLGSEVTLSNAGTFVLGASNTIAAFINTGTISDLMHTLTAATYALNDGSLINTNLGTGAVTSNGAVALNGTTSATSIDVATGTLTLGSGGLLLSTPDLTVDGTLLLGGAETIDSLSGGGTVSIQPGSLTLNSGSFSGVIEGTNASFGLTKNSVGVLTLSGTNTYVGSTNLDTGTIILTGTLGSQAVNTSAGTTFNDINGGLSSTAALTNAGTFNLVANNTIGSLVNTGRVDGLGYTLTATTYGLNDGSLIFANLGTGSVTSNGAVQLDGTSSASSVDVATGTLTLGSEGLLLSTPDLTVDGTLLLGGAETIDSLSGGGTVSIQLGSLTLNSGSFSGAISGTNPVSELIKNSGDTLTLSGTNTYAGPTQLNDGTITLTGTLASQTINTSAGTTFTNTSGGLSSTATLTNAGLFTLGNTNEIAALINTGTINGTGFTLLATTYALNDGSTINANLGDGTITSNGTIQLNGTTAASPINVATGTLTLGSGGRLLSTPDLTATGSLVLGGNESIDSLFGSGTVSIQLGSLSINSGVFSGGVTGTNAASTLTKNSVGVLTLSGTNTYVGSTNLDTGTIILTGTLGSQAVNTSASTIFNDMSGGLSSTATLTNAGSFNLGADNTIGALVNSGSINGFEYTLTAATYALNDGSLINALLGTGAITSNGAVQINGTTDASSVDVVSGTTTLGSGGRFLDTPDVTVALGATLALGGNESIDVLLGAGTVSMQFGSLTVNSGSFSGAITGTNTLYGLTKDSGGTLILSGSNTYVGDTLINAGSVVLSGTLVSTNVDIASGASLEDLNGGLVSDVTLTVDGTFILDTDNTIGTLLGGGAVNLTGGTLTVNSGTFSGAITGTNASFGVTKISSGVLTLSGDSTYVGTTQLNAGTLNLTGTLDSQIVNVSAATIFNDVNGGLNATATLTNVGTFNLGADDTIGALINSGVINNIGVAIGQSGFILTAATYALNDGSIINANLGTGTLTSNGTVQINGTSSASPIDIVTGTLTLGSGGLLLDAPDVTVSGSLVLVGDEAIGTLSGAGTISVQLGTLTVNDGSFSGMITGTNTSFGLTKASAGMLTLSGNSTYVGTTEVDEGAVILTGTLASSAVNILGGASFEDVNGGLVNNVTVTANGTFILDTDNEIGILLGSGVVNLNGGTLTVNSGIFSGSITGTNPSNNLVKVSPGALTLSGNSTYVGSTLINAGLATLSGSLASPVISIVSGATLQDLNGGLSSSAAVTNNGSLVLGADDTIASLVNRGSISGSGFTLTAATYLLENGSNVSANLGTGILTTTGTVNLSGTSAASIVNVSVGSILNLLGSQLLSSAATINVNGILNISGTTQTINILNGTNGVVTANNFQVNGGGTFSGQINTTSFIVGGGTLTLQSTIFDTNTLLVDIGATLDLTGAGGVTTASSITLNNSSTVNVLNNTRVNNSDDITIPSNASLNVATGGQVIVGGNIILANNAFMSLDATGLIQAATIETGIGSVITVPDSSGLVYNVLTGNGTIDSAGNTFVNHGTVSGFMTFSNGFENLGTLSPGFSPGLITIGGNYIEGGVLDIEIDSSVPITGFDQIRVGGTVTFLGTSIMDLEMSSSIFVAGNAFQVIANSVGGPIVIHGALGGLNLTVDMVPANPSAVLFDLATGQIIVTGTPVPPGPPTPDPSTYSMGCTPNEIRAAQGIFNAALLPSQQIDTSTIAGQLAVAVLRGNHCHNLGFFAPAYYGAMADFAFMGDRAFASQVWNRVTIFDNMPDQCCARLTGFSGIFGSDEGCNTPSIFGSPLNECCSRNSAFGGLLVNDGRKIYGTNLTRRDIFAGADYSTCRGFSIGGAVSYASGKISSSMGRGKIEGAGAMIYARKTIGPYLTTYTTVTGSYLNNNLHRPTLVGRVHSQTQTQSFTGNFGLQFEGLSYKKFSFAPRGNLVYSQAYINAFTEKGALDALHDCGFNARFFTGELGFSAVYSTHHMAIEAVAGVEQPFMSHKGIMHVSVVSSPDIFYAVFLPDSGRTVFNGGVNLGYTVGKKATFYLSSETSSGEAWSYMFNAGVRVRL